MHLILSASPNVDGLTAACVSAALTGFLEAEADAQHINLCKLNIERCRQCGNGWGACLEEHTCVIDDDLAMLQEAIANAESVMIITPVYWSEMAESAKCTFDRLRRCEARRGDAGIFVKKPVVSVAAAGGSGCVTNCLASMERLTQHLRAQVTDLIGVNQRNRHHKIDTIREAAKTLAGMRVA